MTTEKPTVFCLGANHRSAGIELREGLYLKPDELRLVLKPLQKRYGFSELFSLSTCNRLELYGVVESSEFPEQAVYQCFLDLQSTTKKADLSVDKLRRMSYLHLGQDAVRHIMQVAASLDSLVIGETQITGQFKEAMTIAIESQSLGPVLNRLGQHALSTAKKVRSQTEIGKRSVSISSAAIDLANMVFGDIARRNVLVLGAGEMARIACQHVLRRSPAKLHVVNRTVARASALIEELGMGEAIAMPGLPEALLHADIVFAATASTELIISHQIVKECMQQRRDRPLFLIDIALPRNIDPLCASLEDVYLFDIDDLNNVVDKNLSARQASIAQAQTLVDDDCQVFLTWLASLHNKPALVDFRRYLENLMRGEAVRTLKNPALNLKSEDQEQVVKILVQTISNKMCGDISAALKNPPLGLYPEQLADALRAFFPVKIKSEREEH